MRGPRFFGSRPSYTTGNLGSTATRLHGKNQEASLDSVDFIKGKMVTHIVGCRIEQTRTPYVDCPIGSMYQPDEHSLQLSRAHLLELNEALHEMGEHPARLAMRDFTVFPVDDEVWKSLEITRAKTQEQQLRHMWDQAESK